jgi:hypothetical protein
MAIFLSELVSREVVLPYSLLSTMPRIPYENHIFSLNSALDVQALDSKTWRWVGRKVWEIWDEREDMIIIWIMDIMSFINDDPYYSLLEVIVAQQVCELRVMTFTQLK